MVAEPFESKTNRLHIRFYANKETVNSSFSIYYSTFRKKRGSCEANELDCEDDTCIISQGLKCNNRPNCKFQKDEENCPLVRQHLHMVCRAHLRPASQHRPLTSTAINNDNLFSVLQATEDKNNDLLFIIIVFSALLGAMTSVFFFNCIRKLIRDQKIIRVSSSVVCRVAKAQHKLNNKSILIISSFHRNTSDNRKRVN